MFIYTYITGVAGRLGRPLTGTSGGGRNEIHKFLTWLMLASKYRQKNWSQMSRPPLSGTLSYITYLEV